MGCFAYLTADDPSSDAVPVTPVPVTPMRSEGLEDPGDHGIARAQGSTNTSSRNDGLRWVSTHALVLKHEALPCTGPKEPVNFEVFSAGPAVAGVPMTAAVRRCDSASVADETPSNYLAYVYGRCQPQADAGCLPPLQIRSYPACQRSFADYSFEGSPLPHKALAPIDEAKVVEIDFLVDHRIEVYTGTATIVLSAADPSLAEKALGRLRSQASGTPPATQPFALARNSQQRLQAPAESALTGGLPCRV